MHKATLAALVGIVMAGSPVWATQWAEKMFDGTEHNFGTVARAATAEHEFKLTSLYRDDVRITGVRSSCGCTSVWVKDNKRVLKSHETTAIVAHFNSDRFLGSKGATITVTFDRPYPAEVQLRVRGYIRDDVMLRPGSVQLGTVKQGTAAEHAIDILCPSQGGVRPVDVRSANPHLSVRMVSSQGGVTQSSYRLIVRLDEQAPVGYLREQVTLVLGDRQRTQLPVPVEARVVAGVTVSPERLLIGLVEPGEEVRKMVIVRGSTPFRIKDVRSESNAFRLAASGQGVAKSTHVIPVTFVAAARPGKVVDTIHIETDQGNEPLEVRVQAEVSDTPPVLVEVESDELDPIALPEETAAVAETVSPAENATAAVADVAPSSTSVIHPVSHEEARTVPPADADPPVNAETAPSLLTPVAEAETEAVTDAETNVAPPAEAEPIPSLFGPPVDVSVDAGPGVAVSVGEGGVQVNVGGIRVDVGAGRFYEQYSKRVRESRPPAADQSTNEPLKPWGGLPRGRWFSGRYPAVGGY